MATARINEGGEAARANEELGMFWDIVGELIDSILDAIESVFTGGPR